MKNINEAKVAAYAVLVVGTTATIYANIAHAENSFTAKFLAAVVPVLLFGCIHLAGRDSRISVRLGSLAVAAMTFFISYLHISSLAMENGETWSAAHVYPLPIDTAMIVASLALMKRKVEEVIETAPLPVKEEAILLPVPPVLPRPSRTDDTADLAKMAKEWPNDSFLSVPEKSRTVAVKKVLGCGVSKAQRISNVYLAQIESAYVL